MNSVIADSLRSSLELEQNPVGVAFRDNLPASVPMWGPTVPAGCRFWQEAQTRLFATESRHHGLCAVGVYTHNLETTAATQTDLSDALRVFADLEYVRPEDLAAIPVLASKPKYVVYGPLSEMPVPADVVLLFVKANQTLILSEAAQHVESGLPPAMGRPACAVIAQAANSGRCAVSLGCCGARAYLDVLTDDLGLFAIPGAHASLIAARVEKLATANGVLTRFHEIRRASVESGLTPSVGESLDAMN
jgi:uncharacterized protein (DUF169 family)